MNFIVFGRHVTNELVFSYWYGDSGATTGTGLLQSQLEDIMSDPNFSVFDEHTYIRERVVVAGDTLRINGF